MLHFGALEAGGTKMVCAVGNAQGQILERISLPTRDPENTMPEILAFFREKQVSAVGVGCFGPVDLDRNSPTYGNITSSPKLQWRNFPMLRRFREALGVPVGFDTDVNAAALGEAVWGCTKSVKNSIYITVGTGVGVGVIIGGAFGKISTSLVNDVIMPLISVLTGGVDFSNWKIVLKAAAVGADGAIDASTEIAIRYGAFLATILDFLIIAFAVFLMLKAINGFHDKLKKAEEEAPAKEPAPPEPSNEEKLLTEIRDLLKARK